MDIKIKESIGFLKSCVDTKRSNDALQILETIEQYFDGNPLNSEIDLALNCIFNENTGVIGFLRKTITPNKAFKEVNAKLLILLIKLIVKFKEKIQQYVKNTIDICLKYILSTMVTAKEKEKCIQIIQEIVINKLIYLDTDVIDLLNGLFRIFNLKNSPARFLQHTYELLGMLARDYPECMLQGYDIRVRDMYFDTLEKSLLQEEDVSFLAVNGALKGFNHFLVTCSPNKSNEPDICQRIYGCVKKLSDPGDIRDRSAFRSALNLLANHGKLFSEQLFKDNQYWHTALLKWLTLPWEDRKCAIYALQTFHCEIARTLERRNNSNDITVLKFFINYFKCTLQLPQSKSYEIRIAIRGFGVMAEACKLLLPPEYLNNLLMLVIQRTEYAILENKSINRDNLEHLPDFVQALSQIMKHVNELTGIQMLSLENIIVTLIRDFHFLSAAHHSLVISSLFMTFENLSRLGENTLNDLLENILLQGIIWTCSHKLLIEANLDWEHAIDWKENTTYKQYLPLWIGLLTFQHEGSYEFTRNSNLLIIEKIYDNLMKNLFIICGKLNLSTTKRIYKDANTGQNQDLYFSDPNLDLEPLKPKDFHIFFNLIDFYIDLFRDPNIYETHQEYFPKWLNLFCETIILNAIRHPLISGFIKLLKSAFILCDKLKYFVDDSYSKKLNKSNEINQHQLLFDRYQSPQSLEKCQLQNNLEYFLKNIIYKCEQTTGELQISCLQLIFATPIQLLDNFINDLVTVFLIGFDIGKSMLSMAHKALTLLEKITLRNTENMAMENDDLCMDFLKSVLPSLDPYLQSMGTLNNPPINIEILKLKNSKIKTKRIYKSEHIDGDSELMKLQKRIIFYLGTLEPKNCLYLIGGENKNENLIKWDIEQNIRLTLNYPKMRPTIYLDSLIPRICELAMTSSDRKTKIAAAELVHAIILYLIGTNNHKGNIWKELTKRMLYLSIDSDIAVREMFEPLTIQIVHYLSQRSQLFGEGVEHLLDCLMDCISSSANTAVRDLSARALREFLSWTIRQTTPAQLAASPMDFNVILSKLKLYCFHSCYYKRVGAALAFNNLYRVFREEDTLIDVYAFDLLYMFCINFRMSEELNEELHHHTVLASTSTMTNDANPSPNCNVYLEQASLCLDHIVRMIRQRTTLLNEPNGNRLKPKPFTGTTLKECMMWVLKECSSKKQYYREKCINIYMQLSPLVRGFGNSAGQFFKQTQTMDSILELCEGLTNGDLQSHSPRIHRNLNFIKNLEMQSISSIQLIFIWCEQLLATIDCYIWLLGDGFIDDVANLLKKSILFDIIEYYLKGVCWKTVGEILHSIDVKLPNANREIPTINLYFERINNIKCLIICRIVEFFIKLLPIYNEYFPVAFWESIECGDSILNLPTIIIFQPQDLGLNLKHNEFIERLSRNIESLLDVLIRYTPAEFANKLNLKLIEELLKNYQRIVETAEELLNSDTISTIQMNSAKGVHLLCKQIKKSKILISTTSNNVNGSDNPTMNMIEILNNYGKNLIQHLFDGLRKTIFNEYYPVRPSPKVKQYANLLLSICFTMETNELFQNCIDLMLTIDVELRMENSATIKYGKYFTDIYKSTIFEYLLNTYNESIIMIINKMNGENIMYIIKIIIDFTEYLYKCKQFDKLRLQSILTILLNNWSAMHAVAKNSQIVTMDFQFIEYMSHLAMICPFKLNRIVDMADGFQTFLFDIINCHNNPIELKSRAIFLLPCIVGEDDDDDANANDKSKTKHKQLQETLYNLNSQYFPLKSNEFMDGSLERSAFCNTFNMLLDALVISGSNVLLQYIINITISDDKHILEYAIESALERFMKKKYDIMQQVNCLKIPFQLFDDINLEPTIRLTVIKRYLIPMIRFSYVDSIIVFYTNNIKRIVEQTETNYALANSGWNVEQALVHRIGAYQLIEILFGTIRKELLQDGPIAPVIIGTDKSTNFFGILTKKAYGSRSDIFVTDDEMAMEYFRQYQCAAYNALCAIVCNTQTELKFYTTLLFKEIPTSNKLIWQKLINIKNDTFYTIDFPQTFDEYPKIKPRLVSIRQHKSTTTTTTATTSTGWSSPMMSDAERIACTKLPIKTSAIRYIQSQNVFDSSLSQDVTKLDLNFSNVRTASELAAFENPQDTVSISLEKLSVNQHEIMATLCAVIKHMYDQKISPISEDPQKIRKNVPQWVDMLCAIIGNSRQPRNVRLFLAKVIENCRDIFRNYATVVMQSILQLLVDECAGTTLNCFNIDLIVMVIEWQHTSYKLQTNEEYQLASDLLKFIMKNCWYDRKEIFRRNLEICKIVIEMWKDQICISKQFLFDAINKSQRNDSKENLCGIQLNAIVMANNLIPWTNDTLNLYFHLLYKCLDNDFTVIYQPASQLLGMCLQHVMPEDPISDGNDEVQGLYKELIDKLQQLGKEKDSKKFTDVIYGIQKYYSKIIDPFLLIISNFIPNSSGAIKRIYLEMFLTRCDTYELNVYREILAIGIQDLLKIKEFKLIALHILNKVISKLNVNEIHFLFIQFNLKQFVHDENQMCRDIIYELFIYIHEHIDDINGGENPSTDVVELLKQTTRTLLLNGLSDTDVQIQNRIFKFWSIECNLSMSPDERLLKLFGKCYDSNSEKCFLSFCTQLILEPVIQDPQSKRQIFEHEYEADSKFYEYDIDLSYRKQNSILMAPLFTETQQHNQLIAGDFSNKKYLRATVTDVAFEPTHDPINILQTPNSFTLQTHNSLLFQVQSETLDRRSNRIYRCGLGGDIHQDDGRTKSQMDDDQSFNKLRRRFLINRELTSKAMAYKAIEKHKYELITQKQQRKEKERQVTLYRRYRTGDYPDLLINNLAILLPLQGLVKGDQILSRKVLVSIVTAMINIDMPSILATKFIIELSDHIENIFKNSKTCDALIFTTLMEIALIKPKIFIISPEVISMIANTNQMLSIAILYLENRLLALTDEMEHDGVRSKASVTSNASSSVIDVKSQHWMELTNLYLSLSEYDVVCGIFSDKLKTDPILEQAIEYEMNGNYLKAQKLYLDIIKKQTTIEDDFAYQSYFNCLENMGNWSLLSKYTIDQIGKDYNELWSDNWNQENLLPHYIKSNLRLILEGRRDHSVLDYLKVITEWMKNTEKSNYIQTYHGEELMMLEITNENYLQARVHSEQYLMRLLSEWGNLSILSNKIRTEKLLNIRKVSEIHQFANVLIAPIGGGGNSFTTNEFYNYNQLQQFIIRLSNSKPKASDSLLLWNTITTYRCFICSILIDRLTKMEPSQSNDDNKHLHQKLLNITFNMNFKLLNIALEQKNIQLADKIIYGLSDYENKSNDSKSLQWSIARSKHQQLKSQTKTVVSDAIDLLLQSWRRIDLNVLTNDLVHQHPDIHIMALNQISSICMQFINDVSTDARNNVNYLEQLFERTSTSNNSNIDARLYEHTMNCLKKSIKIAETNNKRNNINTQEKNAYESEQQSSSSSLTTNTSTLTSTTSVNLPNIALADAYFNLAQFCYDSCEKSRIKNKIELEKLLIVSVLRGMRYHSKECHQMFPILLQLKNLLNNDLTGLFNDECIHVPEWMFLRWIPQILSRFNFSDECYLDILLNRLVLAYPIAIIYQFQLTYDQYKITYTKNLIDRPFIVNIQERLNLPIYKSFIKAINCVCLPEKIIEYHLLNIYNYDDHVNALDKIQNILDIIFNINTNFQGKSFERIQSFKTMLEDLKAIANDRPELMNAIKPYLSMKLPRTAYESKITLNSLSPWLANFEWHNLIDEDLEIPGQYCGMKRPNINVHIKIIKFEQSIKIYESKRSPVKLTIHGSNAQFYSFIIKYGEDLRQDQRIQQLLALMNEHLIMDKNCRQNNLYINTFDVIPLNWYCGMIKCFDNALTIQEIIGNFWQRRSGGAQDFTIDMHEIAADHLQFLKGAFPDIDTVRSQANPVMDLKNIYGRAAVYYSREQLMTKFQELSYKFPEDLIKGTFIDISLSPESYFTLRNQFATSIATMNIAHWLLGIGDRHLSNMLLNTKNGSVIGIDFSLTFGAATRDCHIPEMVPFRLTPQFVNVMQPLGTTGFVSKCMIHTLRALRANSKVLTACMDVFVHEPTIDWLEAARSKLPDQISFSSTASYWEPNIRIKFAKLKLNGINPKIGFIEDLSASLVLRSCPEYIEAYTRILHGHPQHNIRAQLNADNLSVVQQVSCLIDLATDPVILGLSYIGFRPWI